MFKRQDLLFVIVLLEPNKIPVVPSVIWRKLLENLTLTLTLLENASQDKTNKYRAQ